MTIVSLTTPKNIQSAPVEIPLSAADFHVDPNNGDSLIIDSAAIVEAFTKAIGCSTCELFGGVTLDIDPWGDSSPVLNAEAEEFTYAWIHSDGLWMAHAALTDEEINLVLLSAYPALKQAEQAEAYAQAVEIERWKSQQILKKSEGA